MRAAEPCCRKFSIGITITATDITTIGITTIGIDITIILIDTTITTIAAGSVTATGTGAIVTATYIDVATNAGGLLAL